MGHWEFTDGDKKGVEYRNFSAMLSEASAAFIFIFLFMLCTDKKTQYSEDKVINCFIMSAAYTAARLMGGAGLVTVINRSFTLDREEGDPAETVVGEWIYE